MTAAPFCLWSCRGRACPARGIAWADVYGVVCRGGIYLPPGMLAAAETSAGVRQTRVYGQPPGRACRPLPRGFGADVTRITAVGRHAPMPPKVRVAACLTGCRASSAEGSRPLPTDYRSRVLCRGRRPRRPSGVRQTRVYGQPPGRACPAPTARLWGRCFLYYSRRAACPHAAEGPRGRPFNGLPRKAGGGVKTPPYGLTFTGAL